MKQLFRTIISPLYILLIALVSLAFFTFTLWFPQHRVFSYLLHTDQITGWDRVVRILHELWFSLHTDSAMMLTITILLALMSGVNIALLMIYMRRQTKLRMMGGSSFLGIIIGLFGIGCASCGAVLLSTFIGVGFATSVLRVLPLHGEEFGFVALILLSISMYRTAQKIVSPEVCGIDA